MPEPYEQGRYVASKRGEPVCDRCRLIDQSARLGETCTSPTCRLWQWSRAEHAAGRAAVWWIGGVANALGIPCERPPGTIGVPSPVFASTSSWGFEVIKHVLPYLLAETGGGLTQVAEHPWTRDDVDRLTPGVRAAVERLRDDPVALQLIAANPKTLPKLMKDVLRGRKP